MIEQRYCNYQRNYQQRLGYLKLVSWVGEGVRGGPEEIKARLDALSPPPQREQSATRAGPLRLSRSLIASNSETHSILATWFCA